MAESEDKNVDNPTPPDDAKASEPVEADISEIVAGPGADPPTNPPREETQEDSDRNEYGQYEEDWQEAEGQSHGSDDYWADGEQEEHENGYDYGNSDGSSSGDEYEDDNEDDEYEDEEEDEEDEGGDGQRKMTLIEHLEELRTRIIRAIIGLAVGMAVALAISKQAVAIINKPFYDVVGPGAEGLKYDNMMSPFMLYMRISLYMGILIASPWIIYQVWMFVAAGLYKHERKYVVYAVPFSAALFITGALFFLFFISPTLLSAFYAFNRWFGDENLQALVKIDIHVTFMTNMMMVFGFCFQMPVAVLLLGKMGLVTVKSLGRYRKFVIVGIMILAAFVTSPSPLDQIALAIPMWLLYELGVLLVYLLVEKKRRAEDAAMGYEPLDD